MTDQLKDLKDIDYQLGPLPSDLDQELGAGLMQEISGMEGTSQIHTSHLHTPVKSAKGMLNISGGKLDISGDRLQRNDTSPGGRARITTTTGGVTGLDMNDGFLRNKTIPNLPVPARVIPRNVVRA